MKHYIEPQFTFHKFLFAGKTHFISHVTCYKTWFTNISILFTSPNPHQPHTGNCVRERAQLNYWTFWRRRMTHLQSLISLILGIQGYFLLLKWLRWLQHPIYLHCVPRAVCQRWRVSCPRPSSTPPPWLPWCPWGLSWSVTLISRVLQLWHRCGWY